MKLTLNSKLNLQDLEIRQDKKNFIVEDSTSGEFYEMPKICIDAIELMNKGESLGEIGNVLNKDYPEEEVEIVSFAKQLVEFGLVKEVDGKTVTITKKNHQPNGFQWISPKFAKLFFNKITNKLYILLLFINIFFIIFNPELLPHYKDVFLFDSMMFNMLTYLSIAFVLILIHEFGHILAIRSHHLPAKLDIGNRWFLVVFEADLTAAWKLESKQRNPLYFAGMSFEQVILFASFILTLVFTGESSLFVGILGVVIFDIFIKTLYQFCFYIKTDMYYILENITGYYNLMENGKQYLRKWLPFLKKDTTTEAYEEELEGTRLYSWFYLFGIVVTFILIGFFVLPQTLYAYSESISYLFKYPGQPLFWDSIAFLGQTILMIGLLLYARLKKNRT
jgi:putative peptide zinc metalloprotease protein